MNEPLAWVSAITALLAVIFTYFAATQKRKVEELQTQAKKCEIELQVTKDAFKDEQGRLQDRIDTLMITLITSGLIPNEDKKQRLSK